MSSFFLLLKPKYRSAYNHFSLTLKSASSSFRVLMITAASCLLMTMIYYGGENLLGRVEDVSEFVYLSSDLMWRLILVGVLFMLIASNAASALSAFYGAGDLNVILASPIKGRHFFFGKFSEVVFSSSWISVVIIMPVVLLFGGIHGANIWYYIYAVLVFIPFFIFPAACATIFATCFALFFRPSYVRLLLAALFLSIILSVALLIAESAAQEHLNINRILGLLSLLLYGDKLWSPSHWSAEVLYRGLSNDKLHVSTYLSLAYAVTGFVVILAYLTVRLFHARAYSKLLSRQTTSYNAPLTNRTFSLALSFLRDQKKSIFLKELRSLLRDSTQLAQLSLVLAICGFYLYFMSVQGLVDVASWDKGFFVINSTLVEGFVITAIGTRFVYTSISLEGQSFWILKTSPLSIKDIVETKFRAWLFIVWASTSIMFATAIYVITGNLLDVVLKLVLTALISYISTGLAIAFGSYFANFRWEHPSQLSASIGSIAYMLTSVIILGVNMSAFWVALKYAHAGYTDLRPEAIMIFMGTVFLNVVLIKATIRLGQRRLEKME